MASQIDPQYPTAGQATTQSVRDNFSYAKSEIEALQASIITGTANGLATLTGVVDVSASAAPVAGQILIATSATTATWQTDPNPSGTVTTVSIVSANGLAGTVANASTTPAITLSCSIIGILKADGTSISAATAGVDYVGFNGALGTPTSGTLTNCTGLPISSGVSGLGASVATALAVAVGSAGAFVVLGGALGTPSSGTLTSCTGLPVSTGISGLGTGVATALAVNVGSAGAFIVLGGALGTPSSGTLTSCTGLPISTGVSGLGTGVATALAINTGSTGAVVLLDGAGGTPSSITLTNASGTAKSLTNVVNVPLIFQQCGGM